MIELAFNVLAENLALGGSERLAALDKLEVLIRTDCGRQVGEMVGNGWDRMDAVQAYRMWLADWMVRAVERFAAEDLL